MSCPIPESAVGTQEPIAGSLACVLEEAQTKKDPGFEVSLCASEGPRGALPSACEALETLRDGNGLLVILTP